MDMKDKNMDEFEQMRQEMNELRTLLGEQQIVSERLMRRVMNTDMGKEKRDIVVTIIVAVIAIPTYMYFLPQYGLPMWFAVVTALYFIICCSASLWSLWRLSGENIITGNLVMVAERIVAYKRFGNRWLCFGVPMAALWLIGFVYYASAAMTDADERLGFMCGCCIGLAIGSTIGVLHLRKSRRRLNSILSQIEELRNVTD